MDNVKDKRAVASATDLRLKAEKMQAVKTSEKKFAQLDPESLRMLHELQVHQIELELQNEELINTRNEVESTLEKYTDLYDFAPVAYFTLNHDGTVSAANLTACSLLDIERSRLLGLRFGIFVANEYRKSFTEFFKKVFASQSKESCEVILTPESNSPIYVQIEAIALNTGQECRIAVINITERKLVEKERDRLESQLTQTKKMESIGRLAGGVAHEYNNMLSIIVGYTQMALNDTESSSSLHQNLLKVLEAGQRSVNITRQLLSFARKHPVAPKLLNLNEIIEQGVLKMLRRFIGENIDLIWKSKENRWIVRIDSSQVDQLLMNLCINARDAITETGKITIETETANLDEVYCANHPGATPGEYVLLKVSDDGCGISKEILDNIFEPFFTTKEFGHGTGLGLATVFGIVKQNNGFINVDSVQGSGTTVSIYLPRVVDQPNLKQPEAQEMPAADHGYETILVVEDEPIILEMAAIMLQAQGYTVLSATSPNEAVKLATQHVGKIHLLITDVVMPEMNGRVLANRLLTINPDIKLLFMSGYTADIIAHQGVFDKNCNFIQKPFSSRDFSTKVLEVLEQQ